MLLGLLINNCPFVTRRLPYRRAHLQVWTLAALRERAEACVDRRDAKSGLGHQEEDFDASASSACDGEFAEDMGRDDRGRPRRFMFGPFL